MQAYIPFPRPVRTEPDRPIPIDLTWQNSRISAYLPLTTHVERTHR